MELQADAAEAQALSGHTSCKADINAYESDARYAWTGASQSENETK